MSNANTRKAILMILGASILVGCEDRAVNSENNDAKFNRVALSTWNESVIYDSVIDSRDNNVYRTIKIGEQVWMAENLRYLGLNFRYFINDSTEKYGSLYSWGEAVATPDGDFSWLFRSFPIQGVCPDGWHVPNESEVETLKIKSSGAFFGKPRLSRILRAKSGWMDSELNGEDLFGFRALPSGYGMPEHEIIAQGYGGYFWLSEESNLFYNEAKFFTALTNWPVQENEKLRGRSVRCVKDNESLPQIEPGPISNLSINWGVLSPKFSPSIREYYDTIDGDINEVLMKCTRTNAKSILSVSVNNRVIGDNTKVLLSRNLTDIVLSVDGKPEYSLKIFRKDIPASNIIVGVPKFSPEPNGYSRSQIVTIRSSTPGAVIRYTDDGSMPTKNSTVFRDGIAVTRSMLIRAIAIKDNYQASNQAEYVIQTNDSDTFELIGKWESVSSDAQQGETIEFYKSGQYLAFRAGGLSDTSIGFWSAGNAKISLLTIANGTYGSNIRVGEYSVFQNQLIVEYDLSGVKQIFKRK